MSQEQEGDVLNISTVVAIILFTSACELRIKIVQTPDHAFLCAIFERNPANHKQMRPVFGHVVRSRERLEAVNVIITLLHAAYDALSETYRHADSTRMLSEPLIEQIAERLGQENVVDTWDIRVLAS